MAYILNIETATKNCSVALAFEGKLIAIKEINSGSYSHAELLHPFVKEVLEMAKISINQIQAIAVSKGPGSYTGLRIGVSAAKGFCFAQNIPLISIETLRSLAHSLAINEGVIAPLLDARRMEVYSAVFSSKHEQIRAIEAQIINENSFEEYLKQGQVYFLGDGAEKCKDLLTHSNAVFIDNQFPSAKEMCALSYVKFKKNDIEDVAYFEPFYLKDFVAVPQKKKL